jgi:hypothetical protein
MLIREGIAQVGVCEQRWITCMEFHCIVGHQLPQDPIKVGTRPPERGAQTMNAYEIATLPHFGIHLFEGRTVIVWLCRRWRG